MKEVRLIVDQMVNLSEGLDKILDDEGVRLGVVEEIVDTMFATVVRLMVKVNEVAQNG